MSYMNSYLTTSGKVMESEKSSLTLYMGNMVSRESSISSGMKLDRYKSTVIGKLLEEIFMTYEIEQFSRVAEKCETIIILLERLKLLLKKHLSVPRR